MRILAVADIHGRIDRFEKIRKTAVKTRPDLIVMAGDMAGFFSHARIPDQLRTMPAPVFYVRGNSDRVKTDARFQNDSRVTHLHLQKIHFEGLSFTGISGAVLLPFESRICLKEKRLIDRHDNLFRDVSVLVTHPPPRGTADKVLGRFHAGSPALRALVRRYQPSLLICGHIHEHPGAFFQDRTLVVNCSLGKTGAGVLLECKAGLPPRAEMIPG